MVGTMRTIAAVGAVFCLFTVTWGQSSDLSDEEVQRRIAELERVVKSQQEQLTTKGEQMRDAHAMLVNALAEKKGALAELDGRRLTAGSASLPPSIHGASATTRAYTTQESIEIVMDHMWLILCGSLVMFMQAGFAMVEAGCCRAKNVQNILLKNLTDVAVGTLGWWITGYAFAYGGPMTDGYKENGFMGTDSFLGIGFIGYRDDNQLEPTSAMRDWFFQWAFCSAGATIVSGGVAERVNFPGYCIFSLMMTAFIYPVVVGWTWGYGWLASINDIGYMDFAGSGIVHMVGGVGALIGAVIAGPRKGRWNPDLSEEFDPHSLPHIVLGTMILWFGWYGFNCGSTLGLHNIAQGMMAAQVAMNTTIAGATGGLTVFVIRLAMLKKYDIGGFCNGALAGLVSVTAPCGNVTCTNAFLIAIIGAFLYQGNSMLIRVLKVDDPIDAFPVHGICGAWGTLAAALFDWGAPFDNFHGWSGFNCALVDGKCSTGLRWMGIVANLTEVVAISAWVVFFSALIFTPLRLTGFLRASDEVQEAGFDEKKHSPSKAYQFEGQEMKRHSPPKAYTTTAADARAF